MAERKPKRSAAPKLRVVKGGAQHTRSAELDRTIHERVRLAILSALAVHDSLAFNQLKEMLGVSDGNLSIHARKLEEARYIACTKSFEGRVPKTEFRLTAAGRKAFERYLAHMEALIKSVRER